MAISYWWSCGCSPCRDRMAESERKTDVLEDQTAHIAREHPDWHPSDADLVLSHWTER